MMLDMIFGGITGLVGTIWSGYNQRKIKELEIADKKADREHELNMVHAESEAMMAEAQANIQVTQAQVEGEVSLAEARAYTTSQSKGNNSIFLETFMDRLFATTGWLAFVAQPIGTLLCFFFGVVETVKSMTRPAAITMYLLGISTWVTIQAWDLLGKLGTPLTPLQAQTILTDVLSTLLYLTSSAVTWWFGDRMTAKGIARILEKRSGR